jgi:hypothetical protein
VVQDRRSQHAAAFIASDVLPIKLRRPKDLIITVRPARVHIHDQNVSAQRLLPRWVRLHFEVHARGVDIVVRVYGKFDGLVECRDLIAERRGFGCTPGAQSVVVHCSRQAGAPTAAAVAGELRLLRPSLLP